MSNYRQPNEIVIEKLLKAIGYAEKMALSTVFDDTDLKECLFSMGDYYRKLIDGDNVQISEVEKLLKRFYEIDPEFIKLIDESESKTP